MASLGNEKELEIGTRIITMFVNQNKGGDSVEGIIYGKIAALTKKNGQTQYGIQIRKYISEIDKYEKMHMPPPNEKLIWVNIDNITIYDDWTWEQEWIARKEAVKKRRSLTEEELAAIQLELKSTRSKSPPPSDAILDEMEKMEKASSSPVLFPMEDVKGGGRIKKKRKKTKRRGKKTRNKKRNQRKTKKLSNGKDDRCAPKPDGDRLPYSCYTKESLHKIKNIWNNRHPDKNILSNDPKEIWKELKSNLNKTCKRESCWLKHKCIKENVDRDVIKYTFRPKRPKSWNKNRDEWLNSIDITKFMNQYEHRHEDFTFLGPSPINYDTQLMSDECVWEELCKFNLKNIKKNKTKVGIVFNLDPHYKSGSHWVALFINTKNKCIYYFDSYGDKIPKGIYKFVKKIQNQSSNIGAEYAFKENKKRHQYSNSECGMFCLHFIRSMILYDNWKEISTKKLSDKEMLRLRKVYYNP